jgi:hypothetical protein
MTMTKLDYLCLPWHAEGYHVHGSHVGLAEPAKVSCGGTAQYIAGACNAFPDLLAVCEKLAARVAVIATTGLGDELRAAIAKAKGGAP